MFFMIAGLIVSMVQALVRWKELELEEPLDRLDQRIDGYIGLANGFKGYLHKV